MIDKLKNHLLQIVRLRDAFENPSGLKEVQEYIRHCFQSWGYEVADQPFRYKDGSFVNLLAQQPRAAKIPRLIVGAHFDAKPGTPGADDNASGVAAMLEAARMTSEQCPDAPVQFVAFNLEEYGMIGSLHYVRLMKEALRAAQCAGRFLGMLSLEMVGYASQEKGTQRMPAVLRPFYPDVGNFLGLIGDWGSKSIITQMNKACYSNNIPVKTLTLPFQGKVFPDVRRSDHAPFWDAGLPALLVTDTSFFRNPHYHLPSDTLETLDMGFLHEVTLGVFRLIQSLQTR